MKLTVVLLYPESTACDHETFVDTIEVEGQIESLDDPNFDHTPAVREAVCQARESCVSCNPDTLGSDPEFDPKTLQCLAVFAGEPMYLAGPLDDL